MQVQLGSYLFLANGVEWTTGIETTLASEVPISNKVTVKLFGQLEGSSQIDIATKSGALQRACLKPYQDLVLRADNGAVVESLLSGPSLTGVVCVSGPNFTNAKGAEFATYRTFNATFTAEYKVAGGPAYLGWTQTITTSGGGAINVFQRAVNGPPVKVTVSPQDTYKATQVGQAIGLNGYPPFPGPVFSVAHLIGQPEISRTSPLRNGLGLRGYAVSWKYDYESVTPFGTAFPGVPPL